MDLLKRIIGIILVAAVITVVVVLVINFVRSRTSAPKTNTPVTNVVEEIKTVPSANTNNTPEVLPQTGNTNKKSLNSVGNVFSFPGWGVLTCSNSANFEFDPTDGRDNRVVCNIAQKPITVLVNNAAVCKGEMTTINGVSVQKYQVENIRGMDYQWCFSKNGVNYNVTHRVSATGVAGTSVQDYSAAIEEMIGSVK
jgi:cytoskeletal protein RodZ